MEPAGDRVKGTPDVPEGNMKERCMIGLLKFVEDVKNSSEGPVLWTEAMLVRVKNGARPVGPGE